MALQLPPPRRDAHRPAVQGAQGKKGARRARGKAKERRDASARGRNRAGRAGGAQQLALQLPPSRRDAQAGRTGCARRAHRPGVRGKRRKNSAMRPPAQEQGRACRSAQQLLYSFPRLDAMRTGRGARGCAGGPAISSALFQRRPGVQERAAAGFTASPGLDAMRTGRAHRGRRARKARGARGERRKNGAMRPPAQEQGRACRSAQQLALQLSPPRRDAHRPGAQGVRGGRTGRARVGKGERTARCVRPRRNRAGYSARRRGNKAARNRRNRRGRDARTGVGCAEGKAGRKSKERCGGSSRAQEQGE